MISHKNKKHVNLSLKKVTVFCESYWIVWAQEGGVWGAQGEITWATSGEESWVTSGEEGRVAPLQSRAGSISALH